MRNGLVVAFPLMAAFVVLAGCQQYSPPGGANGNDQMKQPSQTSAAVPATLPPVADAGGNIHVPDGYQTSYQYLGSWAIAADSGQGSKEMHDVYASPGTIDTFRKTGKFPDGAVLVKEVRETATQPMTTGTVSHATKLKGWFVMVKDYDNSHPGNKLWGAGWGWSWFDADNPTKTTSTDYRSDCQGCHEPAKSTDWIYTQGYAPLHSE